MDTTPVAAATRLPERSDRYGYTDAAVLEYGCVDWFDYGRGRNIAERGPQRARKVHKRIGTDQHDDLLHRVNNHGMRRYGQVLLPPGSSYP
jgi:hypothetical protein